MEQLQQEKIGREGSSKASLKYQCGAGDTRSRMLSREADQKLGEM